MSSTSDAYRSLAESAADGDVQWAYGTGFTSPAGVSGSSVPAGVIRDDLTAYCLMLGDDALVLSQRIVEWITSAPELEEEVALANIALDLLGQARWQLGHAGAVEGAGRDEDALAYGRAARDFGNIPFVEFANPDFAVLVGRMAIFSCWRLEVCSRLMSSADAVLAAIAARAVPELTYHRDYACGWVARLGDGTDVSHDRMLAAWQLLGRESGELAAFHDVERRLVAQEVAADPAEAWAAAAPVLARLADAATLPRLETVDVPGDSGRSAQHSPAFDELLHTMQSLAREHPGATW